MSVAGDGNGFAKKERWYNIFNQVKMVGKKGDGSLKKGLRFFQRAVAKF
jgi:hypothetical protein